MYRDTYFVQSKALRLLIEESSGTREKKRKEKRERGDGYIYTFLIALRNEL